MIGPTPVYDDATATAQQSSFRLLFAKRRRCSDALQKIRIRIVVADFTVTKFTVGVRVDERRLEIIQKIFTEKIDFFMRTILSKFSSVSSSLKLFFTASIHLPPLLYSSYTYMLLSSSIACHFFP
jgi:uncharacterized membrane protein